MLKTYLTTILLLLIAISTQAQLRSVEPVFGFNQAGLNTSYIRITTLIYGVELKFAKDSYIAFKTGLIFRKRGEGRALIGSSAGVTIFRNISTHLDYLVVPIKWQAGLPIFKADKGSLYLEAGMYLAGLINKEGVLNSFRQRTVIELDEEFKSYDAGFTAQLGIGRQIFDERLKLNFWVGYDFGWINLSETFKDFNKRVRDVYFHVGFEIPIYHYELDVIPNDY